MLSQLFAFEIAVSRFASRDFDIGVGFAASFSVCVQCGVIIIGWQLADQPHVKQSGLEQGFDAAAEGAGEGLKGNSGGACREGRGKLRLL